MFFWAGFLVWVFLAIPEKVAVLELKPNELPRTCSYRDIL